MLVYSGGAAGRGGDAGKGAATRRVVEKDIEGARGVEGEVEGGRGTG